jgi:hypothetical protein
MIYRKLKPTTTYGHGNYIPGFREAFPELSKVKDENLGCAFQNLKMKFYYLEETPVNPLIRLTLPFALLLWALMFLSLPLVFLITGKWGYPLGNNNRVFNWFQALRLLKA